MSSVPDSDKHPDSPSLSAYHDGELRGFARAEVEQHLAVCPRCRRALSDIAALSQALRDLPDIERLAFRDERHLEMCASDIEACCNSHVVSARGKGAVILKRIMRIIPVIDLKGGLAVRATRGDRGNYRPRATPLA